RDAGAAMTGSSAQPILSVEGLRAGYGETDVLRDVHIRVERGTVATVIGPNGAGKSTLLKAIYGVLRPRAGRVAFAADDRVLALARALVTEPKLLLLDEPSAGLAPNVVDEVFRTIAEINATGVALLIVEQNARRSLALSHYGYVLDMGENRFEGEGPSLLHDP